MGEGHDRHAEPRRDEQDVEVNLASVVVQAVEAAVGSAGRWDAVHRGGAGQGKRTEENQLEHAAELVDLKHRRATRRDDLRFVHATKERDERQPEGDGEEHRCEQTGQARVAVEFAALTAKQPWNANLRQGNSELGVAHVGDDHQRKQADNKHKFGGQGEDKAFLKGFNSLHFRHLPRLESRAFQRTPPSIRSSCQAQSTA